MKKVSTIIVFSILLAIPQFLAAQQQWKRLSTIDSLQANWVFAVTATSAGLFVNLYYYFGKLD